ncbi:hypothetical protein MHZ95_14225 [Sporosarcina sp. ACRSM]|uniref:hypothetical protein n=1 Tax=Sporosarcina sp. ACRSM TaxID=2918216 RepID=UPI001EF662EA|nr:hypothetical protein [Sporosarcina sp. ACRSM]MCG7336422.1 hypothetical protein [Sporosarcina sp. ACRSM]
MGSCKKDCSCRRCKSRFKPCDVAPVSKVLKGMDIADVPKKVCDCSGIVNFSGASFKFSANICPQCKLQGGSVSTTFFSPGISFDSTVVYPPQCFSIDTGTVLQVSGFGTLIFGASIIQGIFTLRLLENLVGDNSFYFEVTGIGQNGVTYSVSISQNVPDENRMISFCNSSYSFPRGTINKTAKTNELQEKLNRGQIVIVKNGQVEVEEL